MLLHEKCEGCGHIARDVLHNQDVWCQVYREPKAQWSRIGGCAMRTHNRESQVEDTGKPRINPMKASKRGIKQ